MRKAPRNFLYTIHGETLSEWRFRCKATAISMRAIELHESSAAATKGRMLWFDVSRRRGYASGDVAPVLTRAGVVERMNSDASLPRDPETSTFRTRNVVYREALTR